ncbi:MULTISPECIES: ABC transporter ATP-binding protein [Oceanotoga]|jgi:peptide/nickel transport system ATP-binding protein|uniref:Peptide/nickel transport system ATP-binding protein n=1 Tax=Oceanotoga teriensis TaxID=515440 RepID=A0AA45C5N7_9BACT|nr:MULTISPECIES: ABC transporter ATP-binding protein [Oceanotoga]MDN5343325.1 peptide/nickel transport system ATP-binding protein [Oceanotoga sp.]MDO7976408.1 ABC transporter ATP-binding protein [Oceanotoga teriensis]PWJ89338.1 peptide/nickel transport system ATP-binding protein [Oceanotoga teriensis]
MDENIIDLKNLTISFKEKKSELIAVNDVSFGIKKGEILGLVGESGCGKTVTSLAILKLISKNAQIKKGEILYRDKNLLNLSEKELKKIRGKNISMIFQEPMSSLNPLLKVGNQIKEIINIHRIGDKKDNKDKVIKLMKNVGLASPENTYNKYPHELSGGQRQRIMIAIAIANNPDLIIADEPTTALDVTIQAQIIELLKGINENKKSSILFISHDLALIKEMSNRIIIMYAGFIVEEAETKELFNNTLHPYTKGLLESIPEPSKKGSKLNTIKGKVADSKQRLIGCPFKERCPISVEKCFIKLPDLKEKNGHKVRCFMA